MKSLIVLWKSIANELAVRCCTSAHHDCKTVEDRSKNEGLSFLTITLPTFSKDMELCLERGFVDNTVFLSFKKNGSLPAFLQGFSCLVFDRRTGVLLDEPNVAAIQAIRQLSLLFGKILLDCEPRREAAAFTEFIECEQEVREYQDKPEFPQFRRIRTLLFGSAFSKMDYSIYMGELTPKHGPGATADSLYGNQKYHQTEWPLRLEPYFPYGEMVLPNWSWWEQLGQVDFLEPGLERPVKVISVPKTMKTPRIIAVEPTAMQYAQQAVLRCFRDAIRGTILDSFIGLDDQTPNQRMARQGSLNGDLATLDLSEASDRVSSVCVSNLLSDHRHLHDAVFACRSTRAQLPGGEVISLAKFASMGSALCFPMEAAVFLTAIFVGIEQDLGRPLTRRDIESYVGRVRVFGDDIIVPVDHVRSVIANLEYFGLKVNTNKSFWNGKFRESCGREYYGGTDVSLVRVRRVLPSSRKSVQEIISTVSLRNQLFLAGFELTVDLLDRRVSRVLGHFPVVEESSPVLGRLTLDSVFTESKVKNSIPMVKGWMIRPVIPKNEIADWPALRKCLSSLEDRNTDVVPTSSDHLRRSGRPRVVDIKLGWGPLGMPLETST
ncbi:TPA_asm: RNA-directed RNA polymerase [ssRNA phage Zoerhiza.2_23]|uniref:RNA-directed RNA polymerase n=2 Tax=Leviviricetes TaxID=2842243 RepID=A0A8S5L2C0_9VIRU|nr:RNA-directed RNA polymerase [ssRNA phage Zoerhiza.2_23]QDH90470.1 MAG: RNA-dependent RNA polymerase [Leviviridae sp.]DAD51525.1 TPA_asm: RNA-directed RNA polymerase [ssRNA phage Zoerhiza.2_23]